MRSSRNLLRAVSRPRSVLSLARPSCLPLHYRRTMVSAADLQFGQPLHETHPHLIAPGDCNVLPLIGILYGLMLTPLQSSDSRNFCPRISPPSRKPRQSTPEEQYRRPCLVRYQIPLRCCLLRVSPRTELLLLDRYTHATGPLLRDGR